MIPLINSATSIYSGFVIFSVLGYMAHDMEVPISEVAVQGERNNIICVESNLSHFKIGYKHIHIMLCDEAMNINGLKGCKVYK